MNSLELFSGHKTFSKIAVKLGYVPFTVDVDSQLKPSHLMDILNFDYSLFPENFSIIWASPVCKLLSRAAAQIHFEKETIKKRVYNYKAITSEGKESMAFVTKTFEIINHYKPSVYFIENPIGRIQHLPEFKMNGHNRYFVNYADWGFAYSKETYIFTNIMLPLPTVKSTSKSPGMRTLKNKNQRSRVPAKLIAFLLAHSNLSTK
jgi:hypothetical protein